MGFGKLSSPMGKKVTISHQSLIMTTSNCLDRNTLLVLRKKNFNTGNRKMISELEEHEKTSEELVHQL